MPMPIQLLLRVVFSHLRGSPHICSPLLAIVYGPFLRDYPFRDVDVVVYVKGEVDPLDYKFALDGELEGKTWVSSRCQCAQLCTAMVREKGFREGKVLLE